MRTIGATTTFAARFNSPGLDRSGIDCEFVGASVAGICVFLFLATKHNLTRHPIPRRYFPAGTRVIRESRSVIVSCGVSSSIPVVNQRSTIEP